MCQITSLHLYNDLVTVRCPAMQVIDQCSAILILIDPLLINELNIRNTTLTIHKSIEERQQELLILFLPEQIFKAEIGQRIDIRGGHRTCMKVG